MREVSLTNSDGLIEVRCYLSKSRVLPAYFAVRSRGQMLVPPQTRTYALHLGCAGAKSTEQRASADFVSS